MIRSIYIILIFLITLYTQNPGFASNENNSMIFSFFDMSFIDYSIFLKNLKMYDMIILGENHDNKLHHDNQKNILHDFSLETPLNLGLEFISWMHQEKLNKYMNNEIDEETFLKSIGWGGTPFSFYKPLIEIAHQSGGTAFGINAPSFLTRKISRQGIESLTEAEINLLPPNFEMGSPLYFKRFREIFSQMDHPMPEISIQRFFEAQSTWDDSMAYFAIKNYIPSQDPFFIIVGNFHVQYKLGLAARIWARKNSLKVVAVVQVDATHLTDIDMHKLLEPHPEYGYLGDFVIFTGISRSKNESI